MGQAPVQLGQPERTQDPGGQGGQGKAEGQEAEPRGFPGGPVVKTPHFQCKGMGSISGQGTKIPHAMWQGQSIKKKSYLKRRKLKKKKKKGKPKGGCSLEPESKERSLRGA